MWEATKVASLITVSTLFVAVTTPDAHGDDQPDRAQPARAAVSLAAPDVRAAVERQADAAALGAHEEAREEAQRVAAERASRQASRLKAEAIAAAEPQYADNLDGWIREALDVMADHGIPGSYAGIKRNVMRESTGNPNAVNDWDVNAKNGTPSIGLLQVIKPTFDAYHVAGTSHSQYDPVANIVAACNYAADRYGSIDNVNSAY